MAALLGAAVVVLPTVARSVEPAPNITAYNEPGVYGYHSWMPAVATVSLGGVVKFSNPYTATYHGLKFTGGTAATTPGCTGIPQQATEPIGAFHWEGECTFSKAGTYTFVCTVHPTEMKGTITVPGTPKTKTMSASGENQTEATLNGSIEPEGNTVEYHFEYEGPGVTGKQSTPTATLSAADFTSHSVSTQATGLEPGMTYHFLLVATYGGKPVAGATTQTFTTHAVTAPAATTLGAEGFKETEATLKGTVNPGGEATEYFFEYGTDTHYGQKTEKATLQASGGSNQGVSATLKGLTPGTEYHFRLVAKNAVGGPINGVDRTFKTESPPAPKEPPSPTTTTRITPSFPSTTTTATTTTPIAALPPGPPIVGGPSLAASQHGSSVHGFVQISKAGVGGRLEVDLLASGASLAKARHKKSTSAVVGRLVRSSLYAGKVSFAVSLNAKAKSALRRHHRLALAVKIVLTPLHGAPVSTTRSVVLHA
ncbi:MAG TPA: plastocyanin/azurin family copper-binding protein [Solirubrobacteraceae bacterium]|nr:plastocyanin/azurin family copper-binding protein [Solirubrobacteraceae bacterium]